MEVKDLGKIRISDEVLSSIISTCIEQVPGICGMAETGRGGTLQKLWGSNDNQGIRIEAEPESVEKRVEVHVLIEFGHTIPETVVKLQQRIKEETELMTGVVVAEVNVHVDGVRPPLASVSATTLASRSQAQ
jgi:uncharacterized alkaline shock family protein YloU